MLANQIKTASDLRDFVNAMGREPHFFDRDSLRFFGDTMRNYGIRRTIVGVSHNEAGEYVAEGCPRTVWELYRRRPVKHGLQSSAYFDPVTFARVFPT